MYAITWIVFDLKFLNFLHHWKLLHIRKNLSALKKLEHILVAQALYNIHYFPSHLISNSLQFSPQLQFRLFSFM